MVARMGSLHGCAAVSFSQLRQVEQIPDVSVLACALFYCRLRLTRVSDFTVVSERASAAFPPCTASISRHLLREVDLYMLPLLSPRVLCCACKS